MLIVIINFVLHVVPSEIPPRGHIPMMQRYRDSHGGKYPGTINTFGFGYSLDSSLLSDMAIEGGGMYAFIPDSGFVGTAFVNALGNHLSSYGKHCVLSVEVEGGRCDHDTILYANHMEALIFTFHIITSGLTRSLRCRACLITPCHHGGSLSRCRVC